LIPDFSSLNGRSLPEGNGNGNGNGNGGGHLGKALAAGPELVTSFGFYSVLGEALRNLRTALMLSRAGGPPQVTLITSATSAEGKTVTAVNVAVMLGQMGGRTLLVDADLRRARCHRVLGMDNHLGLTEVLTGSCEPHEMIRPAGCENLFFLGTGSVPPNPTELLGSAKLAETIERLRNHYEYIIIDSSPVLPVSDALLMAKLADGVVIVANAQATPRKLVRAACARLEYARGKILGVILNRVKLHSPEYHDYYRYGDYASGIGIAKSHSATNGISSHI
jgi:receptor protein-tyrosine kinase